METSTICNTKDLPAILTVEQVRHFLGISRVKAYELVAQRGFPAIQLGKCIRILREALQQWLTRQVNTDAA